MLPLLQDVSPLNTLQPPFGKDLWLGGRSTLEDQSRFVYHLGWSLWGGRAFVPNRTVFGRRQLLAKSNRTGGGDFWPSPPKAEANFLPSLPTGPLDFCAVARGPWRGQNGCPWREPCPEVSPPRKTGRRQTFSPSPFSGTSLLNRPRSGTDPCSSPTLPPVEGKVGQGRDRKLRRSCVGSQAWLETHTRVCGVAES